MDYISIIDGMMKKYPLTEDEDRMLSEIRDMMEGSAGEFGYAGQETPEEGDDDEEEPVEYED